MAGGWGRLGRSTRQYSGSSWFSAKDSILNVVVLNRVEEVADEVVFIFLKVERYLVDGACYLVSIHHLPPSSTLTLMAHNQVTAVVKKKVWFDAKLRDSWMIAYLRYHGLDTREELTQ